MLKWIRLSTFYESQEDFDSTEAIEKAYDAIVVWKEEYERIVAQSQKKDAFSVSFIKQIDKDVAWTPLISQEEMKKAQLRELLIAFCDYHPIGYVQGMNFLMMSLLYHTNEPYVAFFMFTNLIEVYQLCDAYD